MLELDGDDGGGQLVRSACSLSALTGTPFRMENVRGDRPNPGLRPQHLTAVETVAELCGADLAGVEQGSETFTFEPGALEPAHVSASVGTAGSVTLVLDAVLPLAFAADEPFAVTVGGGTDVKWSPPIEYLRRVKLPLLRRHGLQAAIDVDRRGFYPAGGGEATLWLAPSERSPIELDGPHTIDRLRIDSTATDDLADSEVADRQARAAVGRLDALDAPVVERTISYVDADSTGSSIVVRADCGQSIAGFSALGERGTPAEAVGENAADAAVELSAVGAGVDERLADQLIVPLALSGGRVRIPAVTDHVRTNCELVGAFEHPVAIRSEDEPVLVGK